MKDEEPIDRRLWRLAGPLGQWDSAAIGRCPGDFSIAMATGNKPLMADQTNNLKPVAREFFIQGLTQDGKQFRPSDWAERLCGVMACFCPDGGPNAHLQYSPYVRPTMLGGVKSVVVNEELREVQPMAYHFVLNFAKDNNLQVVDACLLPEPEEKKK